MKRYPLKAFKKPSLQIQINELNSLSNEVFHSLNEQTEEIDFLKNENQKKKIIILSLGIVLGSVYLVVLKNIKNRNLVGL